MEPNLAKLCLDHIRKEIELKLNCLTAEQEQKMLEFRLPGEQAKKMLETEAEAAEAAIIADNASSCQNRRSQLNDVAPSMGSPEKFDVFLNSITGNTIN